MLRVLLLFGGIAGMAGAFAVALLPTASGIGTMAQRLEQTVACKGQEDIQFPRFPERSTIYASGGKTVLANIYLDQNRKIVRLHQIARVGRRAVLAIEDYRFYQHGPIDFRSIGRAIIADIKAHAYVEGGSTLTQQLIKNVTGHRADTLRRKLHEACLAIAAEQKYSKRQILGLYLNDVYFGNGLYGIETAAQSYFGVHASHLRLPQAALLAGMIAAPGSFDPIAHPKQALGRRNQVLERMAQIHWITPQAATRAESKPLGLIRNAGQVPAPQNPFFVQYITGQILRDANGEFDALGTTYRERKLTLFQGGLKIYTTLNTRFERDAVHTVRSYLPKPTDPEAAVSMVDVHNGAIRVLVSGRNFSKTHQDLVTGLGGSNGRQAGSAFKPFTLVAAFREGIPPAREYDSKSPITLPECNNWHIQNAEPGTGGFIDLWTATQDSVNVVFAQLARDVGPPNIARAAHDMGITSPLPDAPQDCSITLGTGSVSPLEMSVGYATLADNGVHCLPYAVESIVGPTHRTIYQHVAQLSCHQAISPDIAHLVTAMLQKVVCCGTGTRANIGRPQAGKTGTNTLFRDAWFCGYVPQYATAVWVGYPQGEISMYNVEGVPEMFGGTVPAEIWHDFMAQVTAHLPPLSFAAPPPPRTGVVPKVTGLTEVEAEAVLAKAKFTAIPVKVSSSRPAGTVVGQHPSPGTHEVLGSPVRISVSTGHAVQVTVPDVTGMTEVKAEKALTAAGFKVNVVVVPTSDHRQDGVVIDQSPKGGQTADQGSTVSIAVGRFKNGHGH